LIIFKHDTALGEAPSHVLFDMVKIVKKDGVESPRSISDYEITINEEKLPKGVQIIRRTV